MVVIDPVFESIPQIGSKVCHFAMSLVLLVLLLLLSVFFQGWVWKPFLGNLGNRRKKITQKVNSSAH